MRTGADLLPGQPDRNTPPVPVDIFDGDRGNEHPSLFQPSACIDYEIACSPAIIVKVDVLDLAELSVRCVDRQANQFFHPIEKRSSPISAEMWVFGFAASQHCPPLSVRQRTHGDAKSDRRTRVAEPWSISP